MARITLLELAEQVVKNIKEHNKWRPFTPFYICHDISIPEKQRWRLVKSLRKFGYKNIEGFYLSRLNNEAFAYPSATFGEKEYNYLKRDHLEKYIAQKKKEKQYRINRKDREKLKQLRYRQTMANMPYGFIY